MGIYPDGPIDRLLGGNIREFEDTLPQPKLWHANIADVRAGIAGASSRAEKSALGGGVGAGDVKQHGWDALMVSDAPARLLNAADLTLLSLLSLSRRHSHRISTQSFMPTTASRSLLRQPMQTRTSCDLRLETIDDLD